MTTFAVLAAAIVLSTPAAHAQSSGPGRILVVPFENAAREPRLVWLGEATAVVLADELNARNTPAFTRAQRARAFEQLHLPVAAALSRATVIKVGQMLGASEVIWGSYRVDGDELTVEARRIRVDVGRLQPDTVERGALKDFFTIHERLAQRLSGGAGRSSLAPTQPPLNAFESYIKGLLAESAGVQATFFETAIRDFPAFERARLALWDVRYEQGDHGAALQAVSGIPAESRRWRDAQLRAGVSLLEMKSYPEAMSTFTALLDPGVLDTTNPPPARLGPILNNLGIVQLRRGPAADSATAAYYLTRATDAAPGEPDYQFNLGYAYARDRNFKAAVYWLREAVRRDVTDADAHYVLAAALEATGSTVEGAREKDLARQLSSRYEEMGDSAKHDVPAGLERVRTHLDAGESGRMDVAIASSAQREQRDLATFHLERGRGLYAREQDRDAMMELRRAVYLSPYEASAHLLIGRIHLRGGRPQDAIDALKISIWSEETAAARTALGEAYVAARNTALAQKELERALAIDPEAADARRLLESITSGSIK